MKILKSQYDFIKENLNLTLDELKRKFPEMIFTMNEKHGKYFVKAEIKTQGDEIEYLGALKGLVTKQEAIRFFNDITYNNYDKYY